MEFSTGEFHRSSKLKSVPRDILDTGREDGERTASNDVWRKSNAIPCNVCAELEIVDVGWQLAAVDSTGRRNTTKFCVSRRSVADEAETSDLLHRKPEKTDVGS